MRECGYCKTSIEHRNYQAKFCSDRCKGLSSCKKYYNKNKKILLQKSAARYQQQTPEQYSKMLADWRQRYQETKHTGKWAEKRARRAIQELLRTPRNLDEWDVFFIQEIYSLCSCRTQVTGIPHEVDHIIPLQGKNVSGLHVPSNLRIITRIENRRKRNDYTTE